MNLQHSQTMLLAEWMQLMFWTLMNLQHSQTDPAAGVGKSAVLDPYEFATLSNHGLIWPGPTQVLDPYEFATLSNGRSLTSLIEIVLDPYEFATLSNL